jgi:hypothetical protein
MLHPRLEHHVAKVFVFCEQNSGNSSGVLENAKEYPVLRVWLVESLRKVPSFHISSHSRVMSLGQLRSLVMSVCATWYELLTYLD